MSRNIPVVHNNSLLSTNHSLTTAAATHRDETSVAAWNLGKGLSRIPGDIYRYYQYLFPPSVTPAVNIQKLRENILENFRKALSAHKSSTPEQLLVLIRDLLENLPLPLKAPEQLRLIHEMLYEKLKNHLGNNLTYFIEVVKKMPEWFEFQGVWMSSDVQDAEIDESEEEDVVIQKLHKFKEELDKALGKKKKAQESMRERISQELAVLRDQLIALGGFSSKALVKQVVKSSAVTVDQKYLDAMVLLKSKNMFEQKKYLVENGDVLDWIKIAAQRDGHASSYLGAMLSTDESTLSESIPFFMQGILQLPHSLEEDEAGEKMRIVLLRVMLMQVERLGLSYLHGIHTATALQEMHLMARFAVDFCAFLRKRGDENLAFDFPELSAKAGVMLASAEEFRVEEANRKVPRR